MEYFVVSIDRFFPRTGQPPLKVPSYICFDKSDDIYKMGSIMMAELCDSYDKACDLSCVLQNISYEFYGCEIIKVDENRNIIQ